MTHPLSVTLRRLWLNVHLWIGVGLLIAIFPLSVTGALLVWDQPIDRALHPERFAISGAQASLPLSAYADAAKARMGDAAVFSQLRLPQAAGDPVVAIGRIKGPPGAGGRPRNLTLWIDPPTAKVLAAQDTSGGFFQTMHRLHGTLLIPGIGRKVVGWIGWAMFVSCLTGLWLWWPRNGALLKAMRWRRGPSKLFNLHHMIGLWICAPLAVLSLTGVYISFPDAARAVFGGGQAGPAAAKGGEAGRGPGGGGPAGRFAPPIAAPRMTLDDAAKAALAALPGSSIVSISAPTRGDAPAWRVQVGRPGAKDAAAVQVIDGDGAAKRDRGRPGGGRDPMARLMRQIHDGSDTGPVWQTIIFLGGVAPAVLSVTGVIMWLRRRSRRIAMKHRLAEA